MPSQTARGYPYPLPSDAVSAGADDIKALAEAVDTKVGSSAAGVVTVASTGAATWTATVTLPAGRFIATPAVTVNCRNGGNVFLANCASPTTSSFQVVVFRRDGNTQAAGTNSQVDWTATAAR